LPASSSSPEKIVYRKLQKVLLAIEIEQRFSEDQIFTFYAISRSSVSG
jgi:membrane carboxypeptidase/penicillin-binding protein